MTIPNVLTVDLEDWYQGLEIEREHWSRFEARIWTGCERLLALLGEAGVPATFYVLAEIAERHPDLIHAIMRRGHEIGTHGESHMFVYRQTPDVLRAELRRSIEILEKLTGEPVVSHRAPFFSITRESLWALEVLTDLGIRCDSSIIPVRNYRYGIPDAPRTPWRYRSVGGGELVEFPVSTVKLLGQNVPASGGAYFRLYPYALTRALMRSVNRAGWPVMFYIHPWELDPEQPRTELPWRIRTTHYHNLGRTAPRIRRLFRDFQFRPLREVVTWLEGRGMIASAPTAL